MKKDLSRLLRPASIAAVGGLWAAQVVEQCERLNFGGEVWGVNQRRNNMGNAPCFANIESLPHAPDAAFIGVNRRAAVDMVRQLSKLGCGGAICFASGFAESGEEDLQQQLVEAAGDMPLLGPNCYGVINFLDGALLWPDQHGGQREKNGVAIIGQSSNVLINLTSQRRGLPIAYIAAAGNQAQMTLSDIGRGMLDDERVRAIGFYIEGIADVDDFAAFAEEAKTRGIPLLAIKSGDCDSSAAAAQTHTAALAGSASASAAFLRACGVAQVDSLPLFLETLKLFCVHGLHQNKKRGRKILSMSCSGGEAGHVADLAYRLDLNSHADSKLDFAAPSPTLKKSWAKTLGDLVNTTNPLDYHTFIWHDAKKLYETYSAGMNDGYDWSLLIYDEPRDDRCDASGWHLPLAQFVNAATECKDKTAAMVVATLPENMPEQQARDLMDAGVAPMCGLREALQAVVAAANVSDMHCASYENSIKQWRPLPRVQIANAQMIDEYHGKQFLQQHGIVCPLGQKVQNAKDAATAAVTISKNANATPHFVIKSLGMAHKSDSGGVRLNITAAEVESVAATMPQNSGLLIEEMVQGIRAEILLGVRRDEVYGAQLTLGLGGVFAEVLNDTATLILPTTRTEILAAFAKLKLAPLLTGYRGAVAPDLTAAVDVAEKLARLIEYDERIAEIEINPLLLTDKGAVAADVLIYANF